MTLSLHGLRTVIYPVSDIAVSKAWWTAFLGQDPYFDQPFYVGFNVAGYELGLLPDGDRADGAQTHWGVDNVDDAVHAARTDGAVVVSPATDVGEGIVTATVQLPDGSLVGFIVNPHFPMGRTGK
jgi:catechol 2,3-dioxygenase-like lactoylglutathione lyase family enzyme